MFKSNPQPRPAAVDANQLYTLTEAGAALALGRTALYKLIQKGTVRLVELDGRPRVSGAEIARIARGEPATPTA